MKDEMSSELFARLDELTRACPEMRFGQLIANMAVVAKGTEAGAIWDMEDEELLEAVCWQLAEFHARRGTAVA